MVRPKHRKCSTTQLGYAPSVTNKKSTTSSSGVCVCLHIHLLYINILHQYIYIYTYVCIYIHTYILRSLATARLWQRISQLLHHPVCVCLFDLLTIYICIAPIYTYIRIYIHTYIHIYHAAWLRPACDREYVNMNDLALWRYRVGFGTTACRKILL
jgi:hypothetical protein